MAIFRKARDYETPPDHFYFSDFERHHAEIAAYHVDKVLGLNRVPPTVGRLFDVTKDFWEKADAELAKTVFFKILSRNFVILLHFLSFKF